MAELFRTVFFFVSKRAWAKETESSVIPVGTWLKYCSASSNLPKRVYLFNQIIF